MKTLLNGFETNEATFTSASAVIPGRAVALMSTGNVFYPDEKSPFTGIVTSYRNGIASVVMRGYVVAAYKDTSPEVGICKLSTGSSGYLEVDEENGTPYTVVGVDKTNKTIEIIL